MQGVSSQRELILGAKEIAFELLSSNSPIVIASHSDFRYEILQEADISYIEPKHDQAKINFLMDILSKHDIRVVHAGAVGHGLIHYQADLKSLGVRLIAGACSEQDFEIADNKSAFTNLMCEHQLDVVPAILIENQSRLEEALSSSPFSTFGANLCIKPVRGIYGLGFWRFKPDAPMNQHILNPNINVINPQAYIQAMKLSNNFKPQLIMPYFKGAETSVDMIVDEGQVIFAIARIKESKYQKISLNCDAIELAKKCAQLLKADGLINIQTINDESGKPWLLEANLRPSGGVCFSKASGINIAKVFFDYFYMGLTKEAILTKYTPLFKEVLIKVDSCAIPLLDNNSTNTIYHETL
ncbi:Carbamoylphosphate synthase large subunit [Thorsellia anophelis DSM 18579]|uniref:Carbamoylphosphate synthase large subunit n=2 Tax=Thorsellia anophelis TaxID=336804 RepID=A0A1I0ENL4_9GAMM|nr:Carbamoylphosphate synthase large subunit [Thorsellia anophelis DSM 18579]